MRNDMMVSREDWEDEKPGRLISRAGAGKLGSNGLEPSSPQLVTDEKIIWRGLGISAPEPFRTIPIRSRTCNDEAPFPPGGRRFAVRPLL